MVFVASFINISCLLIIQKKQLLRLIEFIYEAIDIGSCENLSLSYLNKVVEMEVIVLQTIVMSVLIATYDANKVRDFFDWNVINNHVTRAVVPMVSQSTVIEEF